VSNERFHLTAEVRTASPREVLSVLRHLLPNGQIEETERGFVVQADLMGESARDLNRGLLSALRRAERRTTLRAEWTAGGATERFFDYVRKGTHAT
jgi:hypothetical protein